MANFRLTRGNDTFSGTPEDDVIDALSGSDFVQSLAGNDRVSAGDGFDTVEGGEGNDSITGGSDSDVLFGQNGNDTLEGDSGSDVLNGGVGNDILRGGSEGDFLSGEDGNDTLEGGRGADNLDGGVGSDILRGGSEGDFLSGGDGNDSLSGETGNDQLNGDNGDDILDGGADNDTISGGAGNDGLTGDVGNDQLVGSTGNDLLSGGNGNDRLIGVEQNGSGELDTLTGGAGRDTFVLGTSTEVFYDNLGNGDFALITDFRSGQDVIELARPAVRVMEVGDAPQTLSAAQIIPPGPQTLGSITGTISDPNDVDLYQITLAGGGTFSATTVGGASFDTQLFLFDANGFLLDRNDDSNGTLQSTLPFNSGAPLDPGTYFLAISSFSNNPVGEPLSGFTNTGFSTGDYTIALNGVQSAGSPAPTYSLGASPAGLAGTGIFADNDLIAVVAGVASSSLSLNSSSFVFV